MAPHPQSVVVAAGVSSGVDTIVQLFDEACQTILGRMRRSVRYADTAPEEFLRRAPDDAGASRERTDAQQ